MIFSFQLCIISEKKINLENGPTHALPVSQPKMISEYEKFC